MDGNGLVPLQIDSTASCYRLGPGSSERMAVLPPGHGLREIDHIKINRYVERLGVVYYVLDVFTKTQHTKSMKSAPRVVDMPIQDDGANEILIDVDLNATPAFQLERRFREFESLRNKLSVCFESLHPGDCLYCDPFINFLSSSTKQPGLFTKLTTGPPQRRLILSAFINQTIQLALSYGEEDGVSVHCDGWTIIPQVVESFLEVHHSPSQ